MRFTGYYESHELPIKQGQMVTIKKGTLVKTVGKDPKPAGRTYKVKVNHLLSGSTRTERKIDYDVTPPKPYIEKVHQGNPKVVWAGPGGYWSEADINDIPEALEALPTLAEAERRLGESAKKWEGRCYEIACAFVEAGLVKGVAVYGHFVGKVHPKSYFGQRAGGPFVQHGWVLLPDGRIFDPTRWAFEAQEPFLHVTDDDDPNYDEGGNKFRKALRRPVPEFDEFDRQITFSQKVLPTEPWKHIEKLLEIDYGFTKQEPGTLSFEQVCWLANAPFEDLQPHAAAIYQAIEAKGEAALIPIDNRRTAERLSKAG